MQGFVLVGFFLLFSSVHAVFWAYAEEGRSKKLLLHLEPKVARFVMDHISWGSSFYSLGRASEGMSTQLFLAPCMSPSLEPQTLTCFHRILLASVDVS